MTGQCETQTTPHPVKYTNGEIVLTETDVASTGFGGGWSHTRAYNNQIFGEFDRGNGYYWWPENWPFITNSPFSIATFAVIGNSHDIIWFTGSAPNYTVLFGRQEQLVHDTATAEYRLIAPDGNVTTFNDFTHPSRPGAFSSITTPGGLVTSVAELSGSNILEVTRTQDDTTESFLYTFNGDNRLIDCTLRRQESGSSTWDYVQKAVYEYYSNGDSFGTAGDLKRVERQKWDTTTNDWVHDNYSYYRYYLQGDTDGFAHGLKYVLGPAAYQRMVEAGQDPLTGDVSPFADNSFRYDGEKRATREITNAGSTIYDLEYANNPSAPGLGTYNHWFRKTTLTLPDGNKRIVFTNIHGGTMLSVFQSGTDPNAKWCWFKEYNNFGQVTLEAQPSAISGYDEGLNDLLGKQPSGAYQYLRDHDGLIRTYQYAGTAGYEAVLVQTEVRQGQLGTPVMLRQLDYVSHTSGDGNTINLIELERVYPDETNPALTYDTTYDYDFHGTSNQIAAKTTTFPVVSTSQNGSGAANSIQEQFDINGYRTSLVNERGVDTLWEYDNVTGAMTSRTDDDGGLGLVTSYESDAQGRTTEVLEPEHSIDIGGTLTTIRRATWTVYDDVNHAVRVGQGYVKTATGEATLVNPVRISKYDAGGKLLEEISAVRASTSGKLLPTDTFAQSSYVKWTTHQYTDCCLAEWTRVYHDIPTSGTGTEGANYTQTTFGYDVDKRQNRVQSPGGTITFTVLDGLGRQIKVFIGTNDNGATDSDPTGGGAPGNNMTQVSGFVYDDGNSGGDSNLTSATQWVDGNAANDRVTEMEYDWRNRLTRRTLPQDVYETLTYDNLDRVVMTERFAIADDKRVDRQETLYDALGRAYRRVQHGVNNVGGLSGSIADDTWYDRAANVMMTRAAGSKLLNKTLFDNLNRPVKQFVVGGVASYADPVTVSGDLVLQQTETDFDNGSNAIGTFTRERYHNATGTGELGTPTSAEPKARLGYVAMWPDGVGRQQAVANYGTNGNPGSRPDTIPTPSDTVLVTKMLYDTAGRVQDTIDPKGTVTRQEYDDRDRPIKVIENHLTSSSSSSSSSGDCSPCYDQNRITETTYHADGGVARLRAKNTPTGDQDTNYTYGTTLSDSGIATSYLLRSVAYPDSSGGSDAVMYAYNRQAERTSLVDQNGTEHNYDFDKLARLVHDRVPTLGTNVDGATRRISLSYEARGGVTHITSYDNESPSAGTVLNDVLLERGPFNLVLFSYQEHYGSASMTSTPRIDYGYDVSNNALRLGLMRYPDSRYLQYVYGLPNSVDDWASRVWVIVDGLSLGMNLAEYAYLGLGTVARVNYFAPGIENVLAGGGTNPETGDIYTGLDRFGRIIDCWWRKHNVTPNVDKDRFKYTYDRVGNRLTRDNVVANSSSNDHWDEKYWYDNLYRLRRMERGTLASGIINPKTFAQCWTLDETGNWNQFRQDDSGSGTWDLEQSRTANKVNEITNISETTGPSWATPAYDAAGNMTTIPRTDDPTLTYTGVYDAWKRMVRLADPSTSDPVQENVYDGRGYRIIRKTYTGGALDETRHFYYTESWQVLEERLGTSPSTALPDRNFIWGVRYIDDLILRDRTTTSTLDERLYAMQDANWNVTSVADLIGAVQQRFAYQAYGQDTILDASFAPASSTLEWEPRFTGAPVDLGTHLTQMRNRIYSVRCGSWLCRDFFPAANQYLYCSAMPLRRIDPYGLDDAPVPGARRIPVDKWFETWKENHKGLSADNYSEIQTELYKGCIGVATLYLGHAIIPKGYGPGGKPAGQSPTFKNCFATLEQAQNRRAEMQNSGECSSCRATFQGETGVPRLFAVSFWHVSGKLPSDPSGRVDLSTWTGEPKPQPGSMETHVNFDFGYPDLTTGLWIHANRAHQPQRNKPMDVMYSRLEDFTSDDAFNNTVFCVTCEQWKLGFNTFWELGPSQQCIKDVPWQPGKWFFGLGIIVDLKEGA